MGEIVIVGMGPGGLDQLTDRGKRSITNTDVLIGTKQHLHLAAQLAKKVEGKCAGPEATYDIKMGIKETLARIETSLKEDKTVTVMVSGDPGFYSFFATLKEHFPARLFTVIPGISALQMAMASIKETWEDVATISLHGRKGNLPKLLQLINSSTPVAALLGGEVSTHYVGDYIRAHSPTHLDQKVDVMANLTLAGEQIIQTTVDQLKAHAALRNCILFFPGVDDNETPTLEVQQGPPLNKFLQPTGGQASPVRHHAPPMFKTLQDHALRKQDVPMSKEETRAIIITKLQLFNGARIWDIGAGTGSIAIHIQSVLDGTGDVYAVEQSEKAFETIKQNIENLSTSSIKPIYGKAPQVLKGLPVPDRIVIGGSGGALAEILAFIDGLPGFGGIVVIPTVTIESLTEGLNYFKQRSTYWDYEIQKLQLSRAEQIGERTLWKGENPITMITAIKTRSEGA